MEQAQNNTTGNQSEEKKMKYQIGWHDNSTDGWNEPTGAKTLKTAVREAKKLARREAMSWGHKGYGPNWSVKDAETSEGLASGRL